MVQSVVVKFLRAVRGGEILAGSGGQDRSGGRNLTIAHVWCYGRHGPSTRLGPFSHLGSSSRVAEVSLKEGRDLRRMVYGKKKKNLRKVGD